MTPQQAIDFIEQKTRNIKELEQEMFKIQDEIARQKINLNNFQIQHEKVIAQHNARSRRLEHENKSAAVRETPEWQNWRAQFLNEKGNFSADKWYENITIKV